MSDSDVESDPQLIDGEDEDEDMLKTYDIDFAKWFIDDDKSEHDYNDEASERYASWAVVVLIGVCILEMLMCKDDNGDFYPWATLNVCVFTAMLLCILSAFLESAVARFSHAKSAPLGVQRYLKKLQDANKQFRSGMRRSSSPVLRTGYHVGPYRASITLSLACLFAMFPVQIFLCLLDASNKNDCQNWEVLPGWHAAMNGFGALCLLLFVFVRITTHMWYTWSMSYQLIRGISQEVDAEKIAGREKVNWEYIDFMYQRVQWGLSALWKPIPTAPWICTNFAAYVVAVIGMSSYYHHGKLSDFVVLMVVVGGGYITLSLGSVAYLSSMLMNEDPWSNSFLARVRYHAFRREGLAQDGKAPPMSANEKEQWTAFRTKLDACGVKPVIFLYQEFTWGGVVKILGAAALQTPAMALLFNSKVHDTDVE